MTGVAARNRVIIVGGGPVGLVSALSLASRDIPVLVLEAHPELFMDLRAGSFHPPTLEVLEPIGITAKLHDIGIVVPRWQLRDRTDGVIGVFELAGCSRTRRLIPTVCICEQHKLTPLVCEMLRPDSPCGGPLLTPRHQSRAAGRSASSSRRKRRTEPRHSKEAG